MNNHIKNVNINTGSESWFVTVSTVCPYCGQEHNIKCNVRGLIKWRMGDYIQNALPDLTPAEREMLMTGICDECWNKYLTNDD